MYCRKSDVMNLLESAGFSRSNPYYIVKQGKVCLGVGYLRYYGETFTMGEPYLYSMTIDRVNPLLTV